ncbi:chitin binding protein [Penicillium chermesinum]|uniref:Chitin binding protein n=1 Tax=Penicillium chermesinum TaxID=63820 RepID=A0A9W9TXX5_9EURO|nr:chitin binding protein [Penicillium chermesinum]KAJ5247387.1 chitin binding protein [Penicillium chermesinum]KAJ6145629.1 chitin binding protein [Penicillium chermesinum]
MQQYIAFAALAGLLPLVHGHGFVTNPTPRLPGSAMEAACGQQAYNNQEADRYGNVQGMLQVASSQSDYNAAECDIWLCKGYKYADNKKNVYSYSAGQTVDFTVDIRAPHTGVANVSVVDTASNTVIGDPLVYWPVYASVATTLPANDTKFSVTIPDDLGDKCTTGGACVLQWYWYAQSIDQTYESCVDFTVGGSDSGSGSSSSVAASQAVTSSSTPAETTSAPVQTTAPVEPSSAPALEASTTLATRARASATSSAATSGGATAGVIPVNGSAEEQLSWVESVVKYLASGN